VTTAGLQLLTRCRSLGREREGKGFFLHFPEPVIKIVKPKGYELKNGCR